MGILIPITLIGFLIVPSILGAFMPIRRMILWSFVGGYLLLPMFLVSIPGPVEIHKLTVVPLGVLFALLIYDPVWFTRPKVSWVDLPMMVWCLAPIPAVLVMNQGAYELFSYLLYRLIIWGLPYWIGRAYFSTPEQARELAIAIFIGGLFYVPLCLFESRFSPQLHRYVYGVSQLQNYAQARRLGGWRPMVFLQHGLALGLWMVAATFCGVMLYRAKQLKRLPYAMGSGWALGLLIVGTILSRSLGALALLGVVAMGVYLLRKFRLALPLVVLTLLPMAYVTIRVTDTWHGEEVVAFIRENVSSARAASLNTRLEAEAKLIDRAYDRFLTGFGRFGGNRVRDERTRQDIAITDSYWILALGWTGVPSLYAFLLMVSLPGVLILRWIGRKRYPKENTAVLIALLGVALMFSMDCLLNAMNCAVFTMVIGAITSAAVSKHRWAALPSAPPSSTEPSRRTAVAA